jgi:hypothetical protein
MTNKQHPKLFIVQYPYYHNVTLPHKQRTKSRFTYPNITSIDTMEDVNIPSENVPAELKACEQILKRAKELKKAEPVVAYWCKLSFHPCIGSELTGRLFLRRSKSHQSSEQVSGRNKVPHDFT